MGVVIYQQGGGEACKQGEPALAPKKGEKKGL